MSQPLSIEELLRKKKINEENNSKPKFLSKKERERLALERRAKEVENSRTTMIKSSPVPKEPSLPSTRSRPDSTPSKPSDAPLRRKDRTKFRFDWEAKDDTIDDSDVLYRLTNKTLNTTPTGSGFEERKRRQQELESFKNKRTKIDLDDIHWSEKSVGQMKDRDWRIFKEDYKIVTKSNGGSRSNLPNPIRKWKESGLPQTILNTVNGLGYKEPTAIQRAAIPIALENRDVIGIAETGSGKTASFVIPLLVYIMSLPPITDDNMTDGPYAIILAPTRELALQIETETVKFARPMGLRCVSVVGGHNIEEQAYKLQEGTEIVIATPGRLVDCIERRILALNQCCYIVMDEADRMVDLGFEDQLNKILEALPLTNEKPKDEEDGQEDQEITRRKTTFGRKYRQTMMYTATWPKAIERMADKYLRNPGIVTIGNVGQATDRVEQRVEFISGEDKRKKRMLDLLNTGKFPSPIIIFVNLRRACDMVAKSLQSAGWKAATMHGSKSQEQREQALSQLRSGAIDCLVATDVAGRGIDVPNVSLVINFQMAKNVESYTHRIGRTGRAGKNGVAMTFLGPEDEDVFYDLKLLLQKSGVTRIPEEVRQSTRKAVPASSKPIETDE